VVWLAVLFITSFSLYVAENGVNAAVETPLDAIWWGITTMTTVGYGDVVPVTFPGRVAAAILMLLGIALFGVITATVTGLLVITEEETPAMKDDPIEQIGRLHGLVQTGALAADEFRAKKAELLMRI
jgi:voltage-gated potassium channel